MGLAVWGLVLLFLLALAQGAAWVGSTFHASQRAEKEAQVQHFVAGASAAMNRSLLGWDVLLASAAEQFGRAPAEAGQPLPPDANRWLAQAARHNMQVRYLAIVDAQGQVLASSDPQGEQEQQHQAPHGQTHALVRRHMEKSAALGHGRGG